MCYNPDWSGVSDGAWDAKLVRPAARFCLRCCGGHSFLDGHIERVRFAPGYAAGESSFLISFFPPPPIFPPESWPKAAEIGDKMTLG